MQIVEDIIMQIKIKMGIIFIRQLIIMIHTNKEALILHIFKDLTQIIVAKIIQDKEAE